MESAVSKKRPRWDGNLPDLVSILTPLLTKYRLRKLTHPGAGQTAKQSLLKHCVFLQGMCALQPSLSFRRSTLRKAIEEVYAAIGPSAVDQDDWVAEHHETIRTMLRDLAQILVTAKPNNTFVKMMGLENNEANTGQAPQTSKRAKKHARESTGSAADGQEAAKAAQEDQSAESADAASQKAAKPAADILMMLMEADASSRRAESADAASQKAAQPADDNSMMLMEAPASSKRAESADAASKKAAQPADDNSMMLMEAPASSKRAAAPSIALFDWELHRAFYHNDKGDKVFASRIEASEDSHCISSMTLKPALGWVWAEHTCFHDDNDDVDDDGGDDDDDDDMM